MIKGCIPSFKITQIHKLFSYKSLEIIKWCNEWNVAPKWHIMTWSCPLIKSSPHKALFTCLLWRQVLLLFSLQPDIGCLAGIPASSTRSAYHPVCVITLPVLLRDASLLTPYYNVGITLYRFIKNVEVCLNVLGNKSPPIHSCLVGSK